MWDYKALPQPGATEYSDAEAGASYSYDSASRTLISYDSVDMVKRKARFVKERGLGGAMWWELSGDRQDQGSLVATVCVHPLAFPPFFWTAYQDNTCFSLLLLPESHANQFAS